MDLSALGLECFTSMTAADTPEELLRGLIATRQAEKYDDLFDREVFFWQYTRMFDVIGASFISPTPAILRECAFTVKMISDRLKTMPVDDFPGRIRGQLIGTSVDAAAYHLLSGDIAAFDDYIVTTFEVAAEITERVQAWVPILLTIDLTWPLVWYRVRKYRHERSAKSNHAQNIEALARGMKQGVTRTSLEVTQYLFAPPEMLRQGEPLDQVVAWAEHQDKSLERSNLARFGFNRWHMAKIVREYANPR